MANNLPAKREKVMAVKGFLQKYEDYIKDVLPQHVKPEQMIRFALLAVNNGPALLTCSHESILRAVMEAGSLGLMPGMLNQAHFVPYGGKCQFQIGYGGLVELALRSGKVSHVEARAVYEGDFFEYEYGLNERLAHRDVHEPDMVTPEGEHITHAYAIVTYKDGFKVFHVMERKKILAIRNRSSGWRAHKEKGKSTPWVTDAEEMFKKTVLRQRLKLDPQSVELSKAIQYDMAQDVGHSYKLLDATVVLPPDPAGPPPDKTKTEKMAEEGGPEGKPAGEMKKEGNSSPVDIKAVEIVAKINHERQSREIPEALVMKWARAEGLDDNKDLILQEPEKLEKLLGKCLAFG